MDAQELGSKLATSTIGDGDRKIVFLHGLMGRGRNFNVIAKNLTNATSLLVDLPDHGGSPWTENFSYTLMADAVAEMLKADFAKDSPVVVLGHSMGGKVAMTLALRHPELVAGLIVEDIAPVNTANVSQFEHLLGSMMAIDMSEVTSRKDADAQLARHIDMPMIRGFLLQNLRRGEDGFYWESNVEMLLDQLDVLADFPEFDTQFDGPVLWVKGEQSDYITPEREPAMKKLFPRTHRIVIRDATHWVHSDQASRFQQTVDYFLGAVCQKDR